MLVLRAGGALTLLLSIVSCGGLGFCQELPRLLPPVVGIGSWKIQWEDASAPPSSGYTFQYQDAFDEKIWRVPELLDPFPLTGTAWNDTAASNTARFYRLLRAPLPQRGKVLSVEYRVTASVLELQLLFQAVGVPIVPKYPVQLYKVDYETITPLGEPTIASGALCLPEGVQNPLPLVSYQHGTIVQTNKAPSSMDPLTEVSIGVGFATDGYAAVVPDYLGLGDSPGRHPFHHARSEATACVDFLRAAKAICSTNAPGLSGKLFLIGYSQGGHATMALLRELERFHTNEFTVTACAPMAGAYDLSGVSAEDGLSSRLQPNPYYFLMLLAAYQEVYRLAGSLEELLSPPYDAALPPMLATNASSEQINAAMPNPPTAILKPNYLAEFRSNLRHPVRIALRDNDVYRWTPRSALRLYHCSGDANVLIANSQTALDYFHSVGREDVVLLDLVPGGSHGECVQPSLLDAKAWFDSLR